MILLVHGDPRIAHARLPVWNPVHTIASTRRRLGYAEIQTMTDFVKPVLVLIGGGAIAQAIPLALGPLLTRLYTPERFGHYTLFAAIAVNCSVVACWRYEYALPLVADEAKARDLHGHCVGT